MTRDDEVKMPNPLRRGCCFTERSISIGIGHAESQLTNNQTRAIELAELATLIESTWHQESIWDELLRSIRGEFAAL